MLGKNTKAAKENNTLHGIKRGLGFFVFFVDEKRF
jgi:hypothetical protein